MTIQSRTVVVEQLPEILSMRQARKVLREIKSCMSSDCPRIVFDCTHIRKVDRALIHMLLGCLEEAMKRSGDVKLAAVPPAARAVLKLTEVDRLFEFHDTSADAVNSFLQLPQSRITPGARTQNERSAA